ncbi:MAG: ABC transporter permease [Hyphomicrobiales bacterium]|nr:ABC transporter permease [Hyphomicrobiales bacterium]
MNGLLAWVPARWRALIFGATSFVAIFVFWEIAVAAGWANPFFFSQPSKIAVAAAAQIADGELPWNLWVSVLEFLAGFGLAALVGISAAILAGWFRDVEYVLDPFVWFTYSAPLAAFYPLFVAWLGLGLPTVIAMTFLFSVTPIYANTLAGLRNADPDLMRAARSFGATQRDLFVNVALPGSVPLLVAGMRLGVGRALTGVIVAELFGATAGIGYSISYYGQQLQTTNMFVSLLVIVLMGVILTQLLAALEAKTQGWRVDPNG